jgi:hypothetical protein
MRGRSYYLQVPGHRLKVRSRKDSPCLPSTTCALRGEKFSAFARNLYHWNGSLLRLLTTQALVLGDEDSCLKCLQRLEKFVQQMEYIFYISSILNPTKVTQLLDNWKKTNSYFEVAAEMAADVVLSAAEDDIRGV